MYKDSASVNKIFKNLVSNSAMKLKVEMDSSTIQKQINEVLHLTHIKPIIF